MKEATKCKRDAHRCSWRCAVALIVVAAAAGAGAAAGIGEAEAGRRGRSWLRLDGVQPDDTLDWVAHRTRGWWQLKTGVGFCASIRDDDGRMWNCYWPTGSISAGFYVRRSDIPDPERFVLAIRNSKSEVARLLAKCLTMVARRGRAVPPTTAYYDEWLWESLCTDLNRALDDEALVWPEAATQAAFGAVLSGDERALLHRTRWERMHLARGRYLLEAAFAGLIVHAPPTRGCYNEQELARQAEVCLRRYGVTIPAGYARSRVAHGIEYRELRDGVPAFSHIEFVMAPWTGTPASYTEVEEPTTLSGVPAITRDRAIAVARALAPVAAQTFVNGAGAAIGAVLRFVVQPQRDLSMPFTQHLAWDVTVPLGPIRIADIDADGPGWLPPKPKLLLVTVDAHSGKVLEQQVRPTRAVPPEDLTEGLPTIHVNERTLRHELDEAANRVF